MRRDFFIFAAQSTTLMCCTGTGNKTKKIEMGLNKYLGKEPTPGVKRLQ